MYGKHPWGQVYPPSYCSDGGGGGFNPPKRKALLLQRCWVGGVHPPSVMASLVQLGG